MASVTADIVLLLIPLWIVLGLLVLLGVLALLARFRGGRYVRPLVATLMKVPLLGRLLRRASQAALERQNPELASAIKKLQRAGVTSDPLKAQQAMSKLTTGERDAYLDAATEQTEVPAEMNRQMRRQMERARKGRRRR
jgi:hypothetical protein